MHIALIHGNDGSDVRVSKTCRALTRLGHRVTFIGWDRRPDLCRPVELGPVRREVLVLPTRHGRVTAGGEARYCAHVQRVLWRLRPDAVHAVNEDNTLVALPLLGVAYRYLVCDLFDPLSDRVAPTRVLRFAALRCAAGLARACAHALVVTDELRWRRLGIHGRKAVMVMNVPEDPGPEVAARLPVGRTKVFVSGGLNRHRGLSQIIAAAERAGQIEIVAAGWPYDDYATEAFVRHPRVSYRGALSPRESLELAAECDAILAMYEPIADVYMYAHPNKVFDAMSVGRPVIINREVAVSGWVAEQGIGLVFPYYDVDALASILASLADRRRNLSEFAQRVRELFVREYTWEKMTVRLGELYKSLKRGPRRPGAAAASGSGVLCTGRLLDGDVGRGGPTLQTARNSSGGNGAACE